MFYLIGAGAAGSCDTLFKSRAFAGMIKMFFFYTALIINITSKTNNITVCVMTILSAFEVYLKNNISNYGFLSKNLDVQMPITNMYKILLSFN